MSRPTKDEWAEKLANARPYRYGLKRIEGSVYLHRSGDLIVRTDCWEGPRGGNYSLFEQAYMDEYGSLVVGGQLIHGRTLRAAAAELDRYHAESERGSQ